MQQQTFASILDQQSTEVERPKPLPVGTYICVVNGLPRFDKSSKKQTEFVEFNLRPLQAMDDVDDEALTTALTRGNGSSKALQDMTIRATYYLTEDAIWRLKKFLDDCGIDEEGLTLRQRIDQSSGRQVAANLRHEASEDGQAIFARLKDTAAVE